MKKIKAYAEDCLSDDTTVIVNDYPNPVGEYVTNNTGLPGWGVALIVIFIVLALLTLCACYIYFFLQRWIIVDNQIVRAFAFGSKDGKVRLLTLKFKVVYVDNDRVYLKKSYAKEAL